MTIPRTCLGTLPQRSFLKNTWIILDSMCTSISINKSIVRVSNCHQHNWEIGLIVLGTTNARACILNPAATDPQHSVVSLGIHSSTKHYQRMLQTIFCNCRNFRWIVVIQIYGDYLTFLKFIENFLNFWNFDFLSLQSKFFQIFQYFL